MQSAWFPMEVLKVTQGRYNAYSHAGSHAMDFGGKDGGKDKLYAPYDAKVVGLGQNTGEVFLESLAPVLAPCGRKDYQFMTLMHADRFVVKKGQILSQWEYFYDEGGKAFGKPGYYPAHLHLECGFGKHPGYLVKNAQGVWITPGQAALEECLFAGPHTQISPQDGGYAWKRDTPAGKAMKLKIYKALDAVVSSQMLADGVVAVMGADGVLRAYHLAADARMAREVTPQTLSPVFEELRGQMAPGEAIAASALSGEASP